MNFCPYCGSPVTDGDKICGHCGCNLETEDPLDAADFSEFADAPTVRVNRAPNIAPSAAAGDAPAAPEPIRPKAADRPVPPAGPRLMGSMGGLSFGGVHAPVPPSGGAEEPAREELHPAEFESEDPAPLPPAVAEAVPDTPAEPEPEESEPLWPAAEKAIPDVPAEPEPFSPAVTEAVPAAPAEPEPLRKRSSRLMGRMGDHSYDYSAAPEESSPSLGSDTARRKPSRMMGKVGSVRYVNVTPAGETAGGFVPPRDPGRSPGGVPRRRRRVWPWIAAGCAALMLVLVFVGLFLWRGHQRSVILDSMESLRVYAESFEDSEGYVSEDRAEEAIAAVYRRAMTLPGVSSAQKDEYGVYIDVERGLDYVYMPELRDRDSGGSSLNIITLQPFSAQTRDIRSKYNLDYEPDAPDVCAQEITAADPGWSFRPADNVNDSFVSMERILHLDDYKMILWHGHGGYSRATGSYLCTSIKVDNTLLGKYRVITPETAVITLDGTLALKPEFFRENFSDDAFDNAFLYFGTCFSGNGEAFARVFTEKGAAVVFVNSGCISRGYNLDMMRLILETFCMGSDGPMTQYALASVNSSALGIGEPWTIAECLTLAREFYGAADADAYLDPAEVYFVGGRRTGDMTYGSWMAGFSGSSDEQEAASPAPEVSAVVTSAEPESAPDSLPEQEAPATPAPTPTSSAMLTNGEYFGRLDSWTGDSITVEMLDYAGIMQESLNYDLRPTGRMLTLPLSEDADIYLEWAWANGEEIHCSSIDDALNTRIWDDTAVLREQCTMQIQFTVNRGVVTSVMFLYAA